MKILILGGYGVFGGRLTELLRDRTDLKIFVAGRSLAKAEQYCRKQSESTSLIPTQLDRADIDEFLSARNPDMVVDASGPFQHYGDDPYRVVKACITHSIDYIDLADAADFVFGISQFDEAAKEKGILMLSGVSSFPALPAAVLQSFSKEMTISSVEVGIAPTPFAGIGLNVMRAAMTYAGGPVKLTRNGEQTITFGFCESRRFTVAPPGVLPLNNIRFSLVDVPDLQVLPIQYPSIKDIWVGAGTVPETLHLMLNGIAHLRRLLRLPALTPLAGFSYRVLNLAKIGEHRGGLAIRVKGTKAGINHEKTWHLIAEGDDGPMIPAMAAEGVIRKWLSDARPEKGARAAAGVLSLEDYKTLFGRRDIFCGTRDFSSKVFNPYKVVLGNQFDNLPAKLRALHQTDAASVWEGEAELRVGNNLFTKIIAKAIGFPRHEGSSSVSVTFTPEGDGQWWERNFGGQKFRSYQYAGKGRNQHLLVERFGPIAIGLALVIQEGRLHLTPRRWEIFGIAMPRFLLPKGDSFECENERGDFQFNVTISAPIIGLIVAYKGWLKHVAGVPRT